MAKETNLDEKQETEQPSKKGGKMVLIIIVVAAILILGVLGFLFKDSIAGMFEKEEVPVEELPELTHLLEPMVIHLNDEGTNAYLKISLGLKYKEEETLLIIEEKQLDIQARVNEVLRNKSYYDLKTLDQTEALKEELKNEINEILEGEYIVGLIFPDFVTQH